MNRSNLVEKDVRKNYTKIYHRLTLRKNILLINIFETKYIIKMKFTRRSFVARRHFGKR